MPEAGAVLRVACIVGARPNLVKLAPLVRAMQSSPEFEPIIIHTGQHYDHSMSGLFFEQLGIRAPDHDLQVGSGTATQQTAQIMLALEPLMVSLRVDLVVVVGDVTSTLAAALVAARLGLRVAHVEAGLRSFDRAMPEEVNRVLTDAISDLLFTTERSAYENLVREGVDPSKIFFVGNVMIDSLMRHLDAARELALPTRLGLTGSDYAVLTLHRPSNVDDPDVLAGLVSSIAALQARIPVVFPVHPRTRDRLAGAGLLERIRSLPGMRFMEPLGYLELLSLLAEARLVLTDSGGLQEETTIIGVPCLTLRNNTERPVTITHGTNQLVGTDPVRIQEAALAVLANRRHGQPRCPELWDGHAAERILDVLRDQVRGAGSSAKRA